MQPTLQELRSGLRESQPRLYEQLLENQTLDRVLTTLTQQALEAEATAIEDGLPPDAAAEVGRAAFAPLMAGAAPAEANLPPHVSRSSPGSTSRSTRLPSEPSASEPRTSVSPPISKPFKF